MRRLASVLIALWALPAAAASAQEPGVVLETFRVPTAEGAEVSVEVRRPDGIRAPVLLTYSPYNVLYEPDPTDDDLAEKYVPRGYARAVADVVGTRNSSGCWDYGGPREQQSGVDLVNFLASQPWSTGKVAMIGASYDGTTANMVAARSQDAPGLAAVVPVNAISRWYGYAYGGGVRYFLNSESPSDEGFDTPLAFDLGFGRVPPTDPAAREALLDRATPCDSAEHLQRGYDTSPDYDAFWLARDYLKDADSFRVPTLIAHAWRDFNVKADEGVGLFAALTRVPWKGLFVFQSDHSAPAGKEWEGLLDGFLERFVGGRPAALPRSGSAITQTRDAAAPRPPETVRSWPPPTTGDVELRLGRAGGAGTLGGSGSGAAARYTDAVGSEEPRSRRPAAEGAWLAYASEPATADTRIAGAPLLDVTLVADREHGHLTPTLFDVAPDGAATPVTRGFLNLAYRDGLDRADPVPLGKPVRATIPLLPQDWTLRRGHRLMLIVASSNAVWAVPDQPGLGVEVRHEGASRLVLPVVGAGPDPETLPGARRPNEVLPTTAQARRRLRVALRFAKRRRPALLRVMGRAPSRTNVYLRVLRGGRPVRDRTIKVRRGRFGYTYRAHRRGTYRILALLRTRDGVFSRRSNALRVR